MLVLVLLAGAEFVADADADALDVMVGREEVVVVRIVEGMVVEGILSVLLVYVPPFSLGDAET